MTVSYNQDVATERVGGFFRLLLRWRGSIYQAVYGEISIFVILFFILSFIYRFALNETGKTTFEKICMYCETFIDFIPVTFILGFYLVRVISRRWSIWENMPFPDRISLDVSAYFQGTDVRARLLRRALVRYVNLASVLCIRDICVPVRKRFPSLDHLIVAGFLTTEEMDLYQKTARDIDSNWWIPFQWGYTLIGRAFKEGKLTEGGMMRLHDSLMDLRNKCWALFSYDWIPIPMVYTQVCTLSVYLFMLASLFGRQYLNPAKNYPNHNMDLYFPFFTIFQITFYLGWLKVAEVLINPMGSDADDFDMNYIVDRNVRIAYTIVDDNFNKMPSIEKDIFWGVDEPDVPHTEGSKGVRDTPFIGSATNMKMTNQECQPALPDNPPTDASASHASHQSSPKHSIKKMSTPNILKKLMTRSSDGVNRSGSDASRQELLAVIHEIEEDAPVWTHTTDDNHRPTIGRNPQHTYPRFIHTESPNAKGYFGRAFSSTN